MESYYGIKMDETKKRYLLTKGKWPQSTGGGKATKKEKILFGALVIITIIVIYIVIKFSEIF